MSAQKKEPNGEQEPSMEEILSSIKRIIADDEEPDSGSESEKEKGMNGAGDDDDVLELTEIVPDSGAKKNGKGSNKKGPDKAEAEEGDPLDTAAAQLKDDDALDEDVAFEVDFEDEGSEIESDPPGNGKELPAMEQTADDGLLSEKTASASTNAFSKLTKAVQGRGDEPHNGSDGTTIEAFVAELLRPSLKEWLDGNLERIVEKVVEQEVNKLARRAELL